MTERKRDPYIRPSTLYVIDRGTNRSHIRPRFGAEVDIQEFSLMGETTVGVYRLEREIVLDQKVTITELKN